MCGIGTRKPVRAVTAATPASIPARQKRNLFQLLNLELCSLDANSSYDFHLQIQDKLYSLSSLDLYFTVPQGTPLIALRKKKVGINTPNPQATLDVAGDMRVDGSCPSQIWSFSKGQAASGITVNGKAVQRDLGSLFLYDRHFDGMGRFLRAAIAPQFSVCCGNSSCSPRRTNYAMFVERVSSSSWYIQRPTMERYLP